MEKMILVSACLAGQYCRWDGGTNLVPEIKKLQECHQAVLVCPEPVYVEYLRRIGHLLAHIHPVLPVVAHVISAERKHCHRVSSYYSDFAGRSSGSLGSHYGTYEYAVIPVSGLINQRSGLGASAAEYDSGDRNSLWILKFT